MKVSLFLASQIGPVEFVVDWTLSAFLMDSGFFRKSEIELRSGLLMRADPMVCLAESYLGPE